MNERTFILCVERNNVDLSLFVCFFICYFAVVSNIFSSNLFYYVILFIYNVFHWWYSGGNTYKDSVFASASNTIFSDLIAGDKQPFLALNI